jgi:hypothetical protein
MSTPGKTHPSVIPPPPIKKIINNKRTLYIPALQAPRQLFNEVGGGGDAIPTTDCVYIHTHKRVSGVEISTRYRTLFFLPQEHPSTSFSHFFTYRAHRIEKIQPAADDDPHTCSLVYTYQLLAVVCIYPIHPSSFHIAHSILNRTALKSNETKEAKVIYYCTIYHLESSFLRNLIFDGRQCIK